MKYSELFYTIQGEGMLIGVPSVFFRMSYCNLRCIWCDTPYTSWEPEDKHISVNKVVKEITKYNCRHVVITGGEPFIQTKELVDLCHELNEGGYHITIETNATVYADVSAHLISMSPKLRNSNPKPDNR
ncbi:TPA: 7-carboxy-7-deazaguanine synthase QueE, partial [Candidatus Poribacteria bacterium]|nr:7-carboxy-7-deazaguanine synthase QueE [Candidatus Poribacteria bacterium]